MEMVTQVYRFVIATHVRQTPFKQTFFAACALAATLAAPVMCTAQSSQPALIQGSNPAQHMEQERLGAAATQRQQKMLEDADKLLQMAQQLKVSVDKTNKNELSVEVIREAERIEKLAHQVKEGMRQ